MDFVGGGILGSFLGGVFRLVPEFLKWLDKKNDRAHELAMFSMQCELEKMRGQQKLMEIAAEREAAVDTGVLTAFNSAIKQQADMLANAKGWVVSLSASVRPILTYYLLAMYGAVKICFIVMAIQSGVPFVEALSKSWTVDDMTLLSGVINYWMLDRSLMKRGL